MPSKIVSGSKAQLFEGQAIRVSNEFSGHHKKVGIILFAHHSRPGVWVTFGRMKKYFLSLDEFDVFEPGAEVIVRNRNGVGSRTAVGKQEEFTEPKYNRFKAVVQIRQNGGNAEIYHTGGPVVILEQPFNLLHWRMVEKEGDLVIEQNTGAKKSLSDEEVQEEFQKAIKLLKEVRQ